ncbi:MAG TPA: ATP-binding protein [Gemmatimonadaceae bacterium]|nr:ATP-binding protein [Gemmatimonadaceae bacterium]
MTLPVSAQVVPPQASVEETATVRNVAWATLAVALSLFALVFIAQPGTWLRVVGAGAAVTVICLTSVGVTRHGRWRAGAWILIGGLVATIAILSLSAGGVRSPGTGAYLTFVLMAGVLLGARSGILTGVVCALIGLALVIAETNGALSAPSITYAPATLWLLQCMYIGVVIVLQRLAARRIASALERATAELEARKLTEHERERLVWALGERVKELQLLHAATDLLQGSGALHRDALRALVTRVPKSWQHVDVCEARIVVGDMEVASSGWRSTQWMQSATFSNAGGSGSIEVVYTAERPAHDEGPFLAEERALINSVAGIIAARLERSATEQQRKRVEQQLRQSQKMEALGTLAGGVAHDFNNILTAIRGNVDLGRDELPSGHPARESFDEIDNASARAVDLVKRILAFSRQQPIEPRALSLTPLVEEVIKLLRVSLPRGVTIDTNVAPRVPDVLADSTQIHQVVLNLGTNAIHAMKDRGGVLTMSIDTVTIDDPASAPSADLRAGACVRLIVSDTGTGMSAEVRERVFEPFFTTKGDKGTGLGLSVVHGIVREHDGAITVYSEPGKGTQFTVYLPAAPVTEEEKRISQPVLAAGDAKRILYVDDEEAIVFLMTRMFKRLGHELVGFTDPHAALQAFRTSPGDFDVVVTDMSMPGMNGLTFAREILAIQPGTHVALASGWDHTADAHAAGIRTILHKPATVQDLALALEKAMQG